MKLTKDKLTKIILEVLEEAWPKKKSEPSKPSEPRKIKMDIDTNPFEDDENDEVEESKHSLEKIIKENKDLINHLRKTDNEL